ncbi:MAG: xanthine dehydrogenase small subunit [Alphaproteobacteria bacterium]
MSGDIRFLLGGEARRLDDIGPTLTVLNYLREVERRCGTKEGCAEGDCGACTVVLGELDGGRIRYRAVNACLLFVAALDGKQLITVEDLAGADGSLHPAQRAMVECHGSQCGFCTPGFVMSQFALYKSTSAPSVETINDALAGNLCRCTGYRPIVAATRRMYEYGESDRFAEAEATTAGRLQALRRDETVELRRGDRRFFAPATLDALADLVARHPEAHILAGGTDLGLLVTKEHRDLGTVIYLGRVEELCRLRTGDTHIEIGGAVTYGDAAGALAAHYPDFGEVIRRLGSVQIRNLGTLAGNLATASPIGDTPPLLMALDARVVLRRGTERRETALDDFFVDYRKSALRSGEFIERIRLPLPAEGEQFRAYKLSKRFDQDISAVCGAFRLTLDGDKLRDARVSYGGMAATPKRARRCEKALIGRTWNSATAQAAMAAMADDFAPISDLRASARYRLLAAQNLLWRCYLETGEDEGVATRVLACGGGHG